jgi:hypothetical protein
MRAGLSHHTLTYMLHHAAIGGLILLPTPQGSDVPG